MPAPFAPLLREPLPSAAVDDAVNNDFIFTFRTPVPGDYLHSYALRIREVSPAIGAWQYWNGAGYNGALTWNNTGVTTYKDGAEFTVTLPAPNSLAADKIYQWSVATRNQATQASVWAPDRLLSVRNAPIVTTFVNSNAAKRPIISWSAVLDAAAQAGWQFAIYPATVTAMAGFDPEDPTWQAQATWIMSDMVLDSSTYQIQINKDLGAPATDYEVWYRYLDSNGTLLPWTEGVNWTTNYLNENPPVFTVTADPSDGSIDLTLQSVFNMLSAVNTTFTGDNGTWIISANGVLTNVAGRARLTVTATASSVIISSSTVDVSQMFPVRPGAPVTGQIQAIIGALAGRNGRISINWRKADGTASAITAITHGATTALTPSGTTVLDVENAIAPADAAYGFLRVEITNPTAGEVYEFDGARAWPTAAAVGQTLGGRHEDLTMVIEKTKDGGVTWEGVWGATREDPAVPSASGYLAITDRAAYLGAQAVSYRGLVIGLSSTVPTYSAYNTIAAPTMNIEGWWLLDTEDATNDIRVYADAPTQAKDLQEVVIADIEGDVWPVVVSSLKPIKNDVSFGFMTKDTASRAKAEKLLASGHTLYLQRNVDGLGICFRVLNFDCTAVKAATDTAYAKVRDVHTFSVKGVEVQPPGTSRRVREYLPVAV